MIVQEEEISTQEIKALVKGKAEATVTHLLTNEI